MPDKVWMLIIVLGIGWGATFFFNEVLLREIGPVSISFARVAMAALFCWGFVILTRRAPWPGGAALPQLAVMGTLMFVLPFAIFPLGQQYVASGVAGIVNALTPVMVVIVSNFWPGGERATVMKSVGVVAGFAGIVLLTFPAMQADDSGRLFGTLVIVLAPLCYGIALNYVRRLHYIDTSVMIAWAFSFAALLMLPVALGVEGMPSSFSPAAWATSAVLGCVLTGAAFLTIFWIMPRAGATKASTVTFIAPVSALLIGATLLGETLGPFHFAGMAMIFAGLLLIDGGLIHRLLGTGPRDATR